mgnify:CR=1 FL=1
MNYNAYWEPNQDIEKNHLSCLVVQQRLRDTFEDGFYNELGKLADKYGHRLPKERIEIKPIGNIFKDYIDFYVALKPSDGLTIGCYSAKIHKEDSKTTIRLCGALFAKSIYICYTMGENKIPAQPKFVDGSIEVTMEFYHIGDVVKKLRLIIDSIKHKKMVDKFDTHFSILFKDIDQCMRCVLEEILPACYMLNENA